MKNYEAVYQWAATLNVDKALKEMTALKKRYPWLPCDGTLATLEKMDVDLVKVREIIKHQEKQNAMHREFIRVSRLADEAIVTAITAERERQG